MVRRRRSTRAPRQLRLATVVIVSPAEVSRGESLRRAAVVRTLRLVGDSWRGHDVASLAKSTPSAVLTSPSIASRQLLIDPCRESSTSQNIHGI